MQQLRERGAAKSRYLQGDDGGTESKLPEPDIATFDSKIAPLLRKACVSCHGPGEQQANFRVDTLDPNMVEGQDAAWWLEVSNVLSNAEMPPSDAEVQLSGEQRALLVDWVASELRIASRVARGAHEHSPFRRLAKYEYNYALQDLLGLPYDFARDLPPETASEDGFENSSEMLHMSPSQFENYLRLGRQALQKATVTGEQPTPVHYVLTMDRIADVMRGRKRNADAKLDAKFNQGSPHFVDLETGFGVNGRYSYGGARYSLKPTEPPVDAPESSSHVFRLPGNTRQIIDLGDHLPEQGDLRLRIRASRTSEEGKSFPDLRISFGFQASNNSQAAFRTGDDITIKARPGESEFYEFVVPLGEISRNPYRGIMELGKTPNPSEYLIFQNLDPDRKHGGIQIDYIEITAPYFAQWPPASHERVFGVDDAEPNELDNAKRILSQFMARAWRTEPSAEAVEKKVQLFKSLRPNCDSFEQCVVECLATVIASPKFLYAEYVTEDEGRNYQLATRLSLFLWSSIPDEQLLELAAEGKLDEAEILESQIERMLSDPRSDRFVENFVQQWLGMQLLEYLKVDESLTRSFDSGLREAMMREPVVTFRYALDNNRSAIEFLHSNYVMVNGRLARHYGIPNVHGSEFRLVSLPESQSRGGLLTQAGLLAMNSDGKDSHPLKRGIWLLERILNDPPPPPPPAVPEIDLSDPDILKLTLKQRMEDHRSDPACMSCHSKIDPWGVAFENFDALGRWRDRIGKQPVDASSILFNGQELNGTDGLKRYLLENRQDQFINALVHKLASYALGRPLGFGDRSEVEKITRQLRREGDGLGTLVKLIVTSDLFGDR